MIGGLFGSITPSYFYYEKSFTKFTPPDNSTHQIAHIQDGVLSVVTNQGNYYKLIVDV
jgi:hypothetical protein